MLLGFVDLRHLIEEVSNGCTKHVIRERAFM